MYHHHESSAVIPLVLLIISLVRPVPRAQWDQHHLVAPVDLCPVFRQINIRRASLVVRADPVDPVDLVDLVDLIHAVYLLIADPVV